MPEANNMAANIVPQNSIFIVFSWNAEMINGPVKL